MTFHHKNIRLSPEKYIGKDWFFITICCAHRHNLFTTTKICTWFLSIIRADAASRSVAVHAFCIMPNHVHLLLEGMEPTADVLQFIKALKTKTSAPFNRKTAKPLWQKKFYDHILRQNDSPDDVAWYIWMNPVRAGLCDQPEEYPFLGSFTGMAPKPSTLHAPWIPPWKKNPT